jgi:sigma-B regulation protein RsbU (phosphoserine phosphatase)
MDQSVIDDGHAGGPIERKRPDSSPAKKAEKKRSRARPRPAPDAAEEARANLDFQREIIPIVGHDLRNPLAAITGSISLLRRQPGLTPLSLESLDRMSRGAARMARLITDIVDFARTRTPGCLPLKLAPIDLHALCEGVIAECRIAWPRSRLVLETYGDGRGLWDAQRIEQALTNLIVNAIQHGGSAVVTVQSDASAEDHVELKVHNQGLPIPKAALSDLFKAYRRGRAAAGSETGLGLGLFIVDRIAAAHGGRVDVESSAKGGTEFVLELPREAQKKGP